MSEQDRDALHTDASLYALGALEPDEVRAFELTLAAGETEALRETARLAPLVAQLGQAVVPVRPRLDLRARVLEAVAAAARISIVRAREAAWAATADGITASPLLRDPVSRRVTSLISMAREAVYPSHRHAETEEFYILDGDLDVHGHALGPGDYCAARGGTVHRTASTRAGCRFIVRGSEEDEVLAAPEPSGRGILFVAASEGAWHLREPGIEVKRVAVDDGFGVATVVVRMTAGTRHPIRGGQIYVLEGAARLAGGEELRAGDFCGTAAGTAEVAESVSGCLLLVLSARGDLG
jgi:anti-sigma factor ChrR (cupin superfamily)